VEKIAFDRRLTQEIAMRTKALFSAAVLLMTTLAAARTKSYSIALPDPSTVSGVALPAGEYKVSVSGSDAVFTNVQTQKRTTVPVKIENGGNKHGQTAVETTLQNNTRQIRAIELAGTDGTLEFSVQ
jgi:roadblock/LC7 domain-containing protein